MFTCIYQKLTSLKVKSKVFIYTKINLLENFKIKVFNVYNYLWFFIIFIHLILFIFKLIYFKFLILNLCLYRVIFLIEMDKFLDLKDIDLILKSFRVYSKLLLFLIQVLLIFGLFNNFQILFFIGLFLYCKMLKKLYVKNCYKTLVLSLFIKAFIFFVYYITNYKILNTNFNENLNFFFDFLFNLVNTPSFCESPFYKQNTFFVWFYRGC